MQCMKNIQNYEHRVRFYLVTLHRNFETTPYESIIEALGKLANIIKDRINTLLKQ